MYTEGDKRRDIGIGRVISKTDPNWKNIYYGIVFEYVFETLKINETFMFENIHQLVRERAGEPHTPEAWSGNARAAQKALIKEGFIEIVEFQKSSIPLNNSAEALLFRRIK
jgi:hypothetical protein